MENQGTTSQIQSRKHASRKQVGALGALIRGQQLIGLGVVLLIMFAAVTALVLFLDPTSMDLPVTLRCRSSISGLPIGCGRR